MLHHKEVQQATYEDIGKAAMCTKETAKIGTDLPGFAAHHTEDHMHYSSHWLKLIL